MFARSLSSIETSGSGLGRHAQRLRPPFSSLTSTDLGSNECMSRVEHSDFTRLAPSCGGCRILSGEDGPAIRVASAIRRRYLHFRS